MYVCVYTHTYEGCILIGICLPSFQTKFPFKENNIEEYGWKTVERRTFLRGSGVQCPGSFGKKVLSAFAIMLLLQATVGETAFMSRTKFLQRELCQEEHISSVPDLN